jgi:tetratricopeptide (TPR) repeat protein
MKSFFLNIALFISVNIFAQNDQLAQNYFDKGDFEKALISYQELVKLQPSNWTFLQKTVECYQQLKQFDKAEQAIKKQLDKYNQASSLVEMGYNYQLQKIDDKANKYYNQAIDRIKKNPNEVYGVAPVFEKKVLIDLALLAYETAIATDSKYSFNYQMAILYGQKGNTEMMIEKFLLESYTNKQNLIAIQFQLSRFITEDNNLTFVESLRKALVLQSQKSQDVFWNQYLSWFYVQQKEYGKAFIQEKAIFKRNPETFSNIVNLAKLAIDEGIKDTAIEILTFVLENTQDVNLQIQAHYYLAEMKINTGLPAIYGAIELELDQLVKQYGITTNSLSLQILQAHFSTFKMNNPTLEKLF